jgi:hypothetical protein
MKAIKLQLLGILLLTLLAGCLGNNSTTATTSNSARISYDGATAVATLSQSNSATLLAEAYQGGQAGSALGSSAGLADQNLPSQHPRTILLSQALESAVQQAIQNGTFTPGNAAAVTDVTNQLAGNCGGELSYSGNVNSETREFYLSLTFDNYCADSTTINGSATASGQTTNNANIDTAYQTATNPYGLDMYNNTSLAPNPYSVSFTELSITTAGRSFSANGYALITKTDELDQDENPDMDAANEPINPNNTPDTDDDPANDEQPDVGDVTTVTLDFVLRDDATQAAYKLQNYVIALTNGSGYVDAAISGRYYDPVQGYIDISTPTPLRISGTDYWPSSGVLQATGDNDAASFTALSSTTYQLDIDSNNDGTPDVTTTGTWSNP